MTHPRTSTAQHAVSVTCERRSARCRQHGEMVEEHRWPDLPPVPPWVLHDGDAALGSQESLVAGTARVWFTLREKPTVRYAFTSSGTVPHAGFVDVSAGASDLIVESGVDVELVAGEEGHRSSGWHSNGSMTELKVEGDTRASTDPGASSGAEVLARPLS